MFYCILYINRGAELDEHLTAEVATISDQLGVPADKLVSERIVESLRRGCMNVQLISVLYG